MYNISKLQKVIEKTRPKTISVDIFDTLLLRKNRAEQWHFWQFSKTASKVLKAENISCSPLLYFSLRNYFNQLLRQCNLEIGYDHEASIDSVNTEILAELARRNTIKTTYNYSKLCKILVRAEIDFELSQLKPNTRLISILRKYNVPFYFVTDMYFNSAQVAELLQAMDINLTVNGISSADTLYGKSSGRSYTQLIEKYPNIEFKSNLHIGDHKHADIAIPAGLGIQVFWLNLPFHRLKLIFTKYIFGIAVKFISKIQIKRNYKNTIKRQNNQANNIGYIFGPALIYYCHYISIFAATSNKKALLVSSESKELARIIKNLGFKVPNVLPDFGRKLVLRSYCYLQHQKGISIFSLLNTVKKVQRRKSNFDALITLGITKPNSNHYKLLSNNAYKEYLEANDKQLTKRLKASHLKVMAEFKKAYKTKELEKTIIGDVGWNNTIQILLEETLIDCGYKGTLSGIYLGLTGTNIFSNKIKNNSKGIIFNSLKGTAAYLYQPEIWESFLNTDNIGNPTRSAILKGIDKSAKDFQNSDLSPRDYYLQSQSLLLKTLAAPSKKVIKVFSKLKFDYGTGNEKPVTMVDTSHSKLYAYKLLLLNRSGFKQFYHDNGWKWGMASYYHFKLIYRLWRKKTRKPSF